jgi:hypothetical protein
MISAAMTFSAAINGPRDSCQAVRKISRTAQSVMTAARDTAAPVFLMRAMKSSVFNLFFRWDRNRFAF